MACWFEYNGKRYEPDELVGALKSMTPTEAAKYIPSVKAVPEGPFQKSWHELALKDAIREAAEKGIDRISWTPGEAQAARYDLSKHVKEVEYIKYPDGSYRLGITGHNGEGIDTPQFAYRPEELPDVVGKEVADKIIQGEGKKYRGHEGMTLDNLDLKVGGEGMKGFYDKMIPDALNKIGKPHGVKVERGATAGKKTSAYQGPSHTVESLRETIGKLNRSNEPVSTANGIADIIREMKAGKPFSEAVDKHYSYNVMKALGGKEVIKATPEPVHYMDIPPSLRDQALKKGFSLFEDSSVGAPLAAEERRKRKHGGPIKFPSALKTAYAIKRAAR